MLRSNLYDPVRDLYDRHAWFGWIQYYFSARQKSCPAAGRCAPTSGTVVEREMAVKRLLAIRSGPPYTSV